MMLRDQTVPQFFALNIIQLVGEITMIRYVLPFMVTLFYSNMLLAECSVDNAVLGAAYKVTTVVPDKKILTSKHIVLWRNGKQVAHEYLDNHVTELWEQTSNGMLRLVRYFDKHARGIEYQPNEIKSSMGGNAWEIKQQLVSPELINSMRLQSTQGKDCNKLESYVLKTNNNTITLQWLANQRLVKSYREEFRNHKVSWELEQTITNPRQVNKTFTSRSNYQTTDYTDIGDNESDPFLMQMIHLGFVEHSSAGFYDAQGNHLDEHHHRH